MTDLNMENQSLIKAPSRAVSKARSGFAARGLSLLKEYSEEEILRWLEGLGVSLDDFPVALDFQGTEVSNAGLVHLRGLHQLESLKLAATQITDAGLVHLEGLQQLKVLDLWHTHVTDAGLMHLKGLQQLTDLSIGVDAELLGIQHENKLSYINSNFRYDLDGQLDELERLVGQFEYDQSRTITNAGLVHLKGLQQLEKLSITGTEITDAGLAQIKGLQQLTYLDICGTQITDAGLVHLKGLKKLRELKIGYTQITDAGRAELERMGVKVVVSE